MTHITIHRSQEAELPATVNVQFINKNADYQAGTQQARRLAVRSEQRSDINVAVVLDDTAARQLAERLLYTAWIERTTTGFKLPRQFAYYEPTDTLYIQDVESSLIYSIRITRFSESRNGEIDVEAVSDFAPIQRQYLPAQAAVVIAQLPTPVSATSAMVMALPMLAPTDSSGGFYTAMGGLTATWAGSSLYQSSDGGVTYSRVATAATASTIGKVQGILGNWDGGDVFDEVNTLRVNTNLPLSSLPDLSVLNGGNTAAVSSYGGGWEIIQFKRAILQSDGSYILSGLLRGRRGTEWAMGGHAPGDKFVMLDSTVQFVPVANSKIGVAMLYKIVAAGQSLADATAYSVTDTGTALKPFSPVLLGGGLNSDGSIQLNWIRRDRSRSDWADGVDMPMTELTESYEVDIYTADFASIARTITGLSSPTAAYSLADQTTDFGSGQSELFFAVYQMSAVVGRGYPAYGHFLADGSEVPVTFPAPATIPAPTPV